MNYDAVIESLRPDVERGLSRDDGLSLGDAKFIAAGHPVWRSIVKAAEPLHDELEAYAEKMKGGNPDDL